MQNVCLGLRTTTEIWGVWHLKAPQYQTAVIFIKCYHAQN
jgi:hypothetical protein